MVARSKCLTNRMESQTPVGARCSLGSLQGFALIVMTLPYRGLRQFVLHLHPGRAPAGCIWMLVFTLLLALPGCRRGGQQPSSPKTGDPPPSTGQGSLSAEAIAWNNNAVGLMGRYQYSEARSAFEQLVEEHPDWLDAKVNLAIACLNEDQGGARALPLLQSVLDSDANHARANYCTGVLLREQGHLDAALLHFRRVFELDGEDAFVAFLIGECVEVQSKAEAIQWYETAVRIDPYFRTPYYRLFDLKRLAGERAEAEGYHEKFQQLADSLLSVSFKVNYAQMGPKATCIVVDSELDSTAVPDGPLFQAARPLLATDAAWQRNAALEPASITACDFDGDGRIDLFAAGVVPAGSAQRNSLFRQREDQTFELDADHPLAGVSQVNAAVWGDFDNDQLTDVYLCRTGPNQLWRQVELGVWQDVTQATNTGAGDTHTVDAAALDADHDGDLDLFVVNADDPNELLNNNRDGTFRPMAVEAGIAGTGASRSVLPLDVDFDRDLDLIVINKTAPHEVFINDLTWNYRRGEVLSDFATTDVSAAVAGDLDLDGRSEIYAVAGPSLMRWSTEDGKTWTGDTMVADTGVLDDNGQVALADVNGDGRLDFTVGAASWQVWEQQNMRGPSFAAEDVELAGWTLALLDVQGPAVIGIERSGRPLIWKPGPGRLPFVGLTLAGSTAGGSRARSNASGLGARAELRIGSRWAVVDHLRSHSGPGQSLQPLAIGLGRESAADFIRVHWPDGVAQVVLSVLPGHHRIVEEDQLPTSCPVLFVWDGQEFRFVSDLLSVGGLGYFVAPEQYASPDPSEHFLVPEGLLAPRENRYLLKLCEPMEELTYLDHIQLTSYELPPGWRMTLDERMGIGLPRPTGEPVFYQREVAPRRAWNDRGEDVAAELQSAGDRSAPPGELDRRFVGRLAREHVLTVQFDEPIKQGDEQPVFIADGWVEFPYSQTLFAGWQAGVRFSAPTLEYQDKDGQWQVLLREFGYPAGMPRQMSVSLAGLPAAVTTIRLRTNLEIYWDRIAIAYAEPCPDVKTQVHQLRRAELRECGLIPRTLLDQQRPHFNYAQRLPYSITRDPTGFYSAFGDVVPLVADRDNALAIFGPGEEIHFEFDAPVTDLRSGWTRRTMLSTFGWCKDMDMYTGQGQSVEPLPHTGPVDQRRARLHLQHNGRFQTGRTE